MQCSCDLCAQNGDKQEACIVAIGRGVSKHKSPVCYYCRLDMQPSLLSQTAKVAAVSKNSKAHHLDRLWQPPNISGAHLMP